MWTLLKREIEDTWVYLLVVAVIAAGSIIWVELMLVWHPASPSEQSIKVMFIGFTFGYLLLCVLLLGVGANRMVFDRANGISTFYAGHLTTRGRFFIVRLLLGAMFAALFYIPLAYWFIWRSLRIIPIWRIIEDAPVRKLAGAAFFFFLFLLGCYSLGLRMGLYNKRIVYTIGTLCLGAIFLSFIVLKGFGFEATVILVVLDAAMIYSAWRDYSAIAL